MKSVKLLRAAAVALSLGGLVPAASAQMMASRNAAVAPADYEFIVKAAYGGWGEIAAAQTALRNSGDPRLQSIANMMIADHTAANQQLAAIAAARGITAPTLPDSARQGTLEIMQRMTGPAFDHAYLMQQIADHRVAITLFETEAAISADPALRAFAQNALPILQRHLQAVSAAANFASAR